MPGLSPRVRRYPRQEALCAPAYGSISACAEVPSPSSAFFARKWVYLRVCGGTLLRSTPLFLHGGLSPRVRRYRSRDQVTKIAAGSISACAEVPPSGFERDRAEEVYLRVCGGTAAQENLPCRPAGLSPRVRRYRDEGDRKTDGGRSISACAEVPLWPQRPRFHPGVYLRVCGGTAGDGVGHALAHGLSPRVRRYPPSSCHSTT